MDRYNVYDLQSPKSRDSLRKIVAKFNVLVKEDKNKNKAAILAQVLKDYDISPKHYELAKKSSASVLDSDDHRDIADRKVKDDEELKKRRFAYIVKALVNITLSEDAVSIFSRNEKLKEIQRKYHDLIVKLEAAEWARQLEIAELERIKLEEQEFQQMMAEYDRYHQEVMAKMNEYHREVQDIRQKLTDVQARKASIRQELQADARALAKDLIQNYVSPDGKRPLKDIPEDKMAKLIEVYGEEKHQIKIEEHRLDKAEKMLKKELDGKAQKGFPLAGFKREQVMSEDPRKEKIDRKREELKQRKEDIFTNAANQSGIDVNAIDQVTKEDIASKIDNIVDRHVDNLHKASQEEDMHNERLKDVRQEASEDVSKYKDKVTNMTQYEAYQVEAKSINVSAENQDQNLDSLDAMLAALNDDKPEDNPKPSLS